MHEAGHQFWYGLVGNNEFEHAWMDEGLNTFSTARVLAQQPPLEHVTLRLFGGFVPWVFGTCPSTRTIMTGWRAIAPAAESDAPSTPSWRYSPATGGYITYNKTAVWLHTLERLIGWPTAAAGLSLFFTASRVHASHTRRLFCALSEGAGQDLDVVFRRGLPRLEYGRLRHPAVHERAVGGERLD